MLSSWDRASGGYVPLRTTTWLVNKIEFSGVSF